MVLVHTRNSINLLFVEKMNDTILISQIKKTESQTDETSQNCTVADTDLEPPFL